MNCCSRSIRPRPRGKCARRSAYCPDGSVRVTRCGVFVASRVPAGGPDNALPPSGWLLSDESARRFPCCGVARNRNGIPASGVPAAANRGFVIPRRRLGRCVGFMWSEHADGPFRLHYDRGFLVATKRSRHEPVPLGAPMRARRPPPLDYGMLRKVHPMRPSMGAIPRLGRPDTSATRHRDGPPRMDPLRTRSAARQCRDLRTRPGHARV